MKKKTVVLNHFEKLEKTPTVKVLIIFFYAIICKIKLPTLIALS